MFADIKSENISPDILEGYGAGYSFDGCVVEARIKNSHIWELWTDYKNSDIKNAHYQETPFLEFFIIKTLKYDESAYRLANAE